jgi:hypothetical protein
MISELLPLLMVEDQSYAELWQQAAVSYGNGTVIVVPGGGRTQTSIFHGHHSV